MSEYDDFDLRHIQKLNILNKVGRCFFKINLRNLLLKDMSRVFYIANNLSSVCYPEKALPIIDF